MAAIAWELTARFATRLAIPNRCSSCDVDTALCDVALRIAALVEGSVYGSVSIVAAC